MLGTVENRIVDRVVPATHTPDALSLKPCCARWPTKGARVFMEASSHAIVQERIAGTLHWGGVHQHFSRPPRLPRRLQRVHPSEEAVV